MTSDELKIAAQRWATGGIVPPDVDGSAGLFTCQQYDAANAREIADAYLEAIGDVEYLKKYRHKLADENDRLSMRVAELEGRLKWIKDATEIPNA